MKTAAPRFSGRKVVELRNRAGFTQNELARRAGIHTSQLSRYETGGQVPGADVVGVLAGALCCGVSDFFTEDGADEDDEEADLLEAAHTLERLGVYDMAERLRLRAREINRRSARRSGSVT